MVFGQKGWLVKVTHLNYILLGIIMGMLYRNVVFGGSIPDVFADGFKLSRLMIKTGIILLGSLYTVQAIVTARGDGDLPDRRLRDPEPS